MFCGLLSIHIFMLLFRFLSDFTRKCKTAIEIGKPFDNIYDNFLLFIQKNKQLLQFRKFCFLFLNHKARNTEFQRHCTSIIKPPHVCEQRMARIELCHLSLGLEQFVCVYNNETQQTITIA